MIKNQLQFHVGVKVRLASDPSLKGEIVFRDAMEGDLWGVKYLNGANAHRGSMYRGEELILDVMISERNYARNSPYISI